MADPMRDYFVGGSNTADRQAQAAKAAALDQFKAVSATDAVGKMSGDVLGGYAPMFSARRHMSPAIGAVVMVDIGRDVNGTRIHPAMITRVWGHDCVNARVILDSPDTPLWLTSIMHKSKITAPTSYMQSRPTYWFHDHDGPPLT